MFPYSIKLLAAAVILGLERCLSDQISGYFDMFDRCDDYYGTVLNAFYTPLLERCCVNCLRNPNCFSITYNPGTKVCITNAGKTTRFPTECRGGTVKYLPLKKSPDRPILHGDCASDADCTTTNSRCYNGTCTCIWGYSYNPENVSCLTECDKYGSTFSLVEYHFLERFNEQNVLETTPDACKKVCVNETRFICRSFDFYVNARKCFLSSATPTTQSKYGLVETKPNMKRDYYHRNCE